jgi:hypothetical protein
MKINTAYIKQEIPNLITQAEFDEYAEVWEENMADYEDDDEDPEIVAMKKIDIRKHMAVGKNWKRVHKSKIGSDIHRVFELGPGPVFEGIFKMEIITDSKDSSILHTVFYNE